MRQHTASSQNEEGPELAASSACVTGAAGVQEICRDIRKLDHAKANLTATITAFRRLSMLVTAVGTSTPLAEAHTAGGSAEQACRASCPAC